jgi:tricorn protease-like protein
LHLGEVATGKLLGVKDVGAVEEARMSADGKRVVLGCSDGSVKLVDPHTGMIRQTFPGPEGELGVRFALAPKGGWLATASYNGETVQIRQLPPSGK